MLIGGNRPGADGRFATHRSKLPEAVLRAFACPVCSGGLDVRDDGCHCTRCTQAYPITDAGQLDLRLPVTKKYPMEFSLGPRAAGPILDRIGPIPDNPKPALDYQSIPIPPLLRRGHRLTPALISHFPRKSDGSGLMLDLGCGHEDFKTICAHTQMEYVGMDYGGPAALLGDAHAMPFKDESFDFAISFAVLEHLRHPFVGLRELIRVLKPGAMFIGSVGFIEPFHLNSYFPASPLGTYELLSASGFDVRYIEPNVEWSGLRVLAHLGLFPHAPGLLADLSILPLRALHRLWWKIAHALQRRVETSEGRRRINNAGGFRFVCQKPAADVAERA